MGGIFSLELMPFIHRVEIPWRHTEKGWWIFIVFVTSIRSLEIAARNHDKVTFFQEPSPIRIHRAESER